MRIQAVDTQKEKYLPLLLVADEQREMIERYLARGTLYVLQDGAVKCVCVVTDEGGGVLEIKNIAVVPQAQRRGYGTAMIAFLCKTYAGRYRVLQVGTGDSPMTIPFYEACGFTRHHIREDFFVKHYDYPIYECGVQLKDMIVLRRLL